jgi:hypothetical protein
MNIVENDDEDLARANSKFTQVQYDAHADQ